MSVDPNFLFIGAARCASTWVHECLKEHPDVLVPERPKELHFFNRDENYDKGLDWYRGFFAHRDGQQAVGEVTPSYLCSANAPARIHRHYPNIRMVVSLRDPIERAYSSYKGHVLAGRINTGEDIVEASDRLVFDNQASIVEHGFYHRHIQRYLKLFSREQLLVLIYEDLKSDPRGFIQRIYEFLGVDSGFVPSLLKQRVNENFSSGSASSAFVRRMNRMGLWLRPILPGVHKRYEQGIRLIRNRIVKKEPTEVPKDVQDRLKRVYAEENRKLAAFLDRDLREWA